MTIFLYKRIPNPWLAASGGHQGHIVHNERCVFSPCMYPDSRRPSARETLKGNLKNFETQDVVLKRKHSWTNTAIKMFNFLQLNKKGAPLISGENSSWSDQPEDVAHRRTFPFFTKYLTTCHHQIDGIWWWEFGWHYAVTWIMGGEALREVKADEKCTWSWKTNGISMCPA